MSQLVPSNTVSVECLVVLPYILVFSCAYCYVSLAKQMNEQGRTQDHGRSLYCPSFPLALTSATIHSISPHLPLNPQVIKSRHGLREHCDGGARLPNDFQYRYIRQQSYLFPKISMQSVRISKDKGLDTCYSAAYLSQSRHQQRFTISEVAADWHELVVPQRIMWPSIACAIAQLDQQYS